MSPLKTRILELAKDGAEWTANQFSEECQCSVSGAGNAAMTLTKLGYLKIARSVPNGLGGNPKNFYVWTGNGKHVAMLEAERAEDEKFRRRHQVKPKGDPELAAAITNMVRMGQIERSEHGVA